MRRYDALWIQRPYFPAALSIYRMARQHGVSVIVDIDDLLWDVPLGNPFRVECRPDMISSCLGMLLRADVVVASTRALQTAIQGLGCKDVRLALNCLPDRLPWPTLQPRSNAVAWRGGSVHVADVREYESTIGTLCRDAGARFLALGSDAPVVAGIVGEDLYAAAPVVEIDDYLGMLAREAPKVIVVPLEAHAFNESKSDIAALEAAYAGSLVVGPDTDAWLLEPSGGRWPHAETYAIGDVGSFREAMARALAASEEEVRTRVDAARAWIDGHRRNRHVARERIKAVDSACDR